MLQEIVDYIVSRIVELDWIAIVLGVVIEAIIVPIPSPLIPMAAGFALLKDVEGLNFIFILVIKIGLIGGLTSTFMNIPFYYLGKVGGRPIVKRFSLFLGIDEDDLDRAISLIGGRSPLQVAIYRVIPIMPLSLVSISSGILEMDIWRFTISTFIGSIPRYVILGYIGWIVRDLYMELALLLDNAETALIILLAIGLIGYILVKKFIVR